MGYWIRIVRDKSNFKIEWCIIWQRMTDEIILKFFLNCCMFVELGLNVRLNIYPKKKCRRCQNEILNASLTIFTLHLFNTTPPTVCKSF